MKLASSWHQQLPLAILNYCKFKVNEHLLLLLGPKHLLHYLNKPHMITKLNI